jgi:hypothetical protein
LYYPACDGRSNKLNSCNRMQGSVKKMILGQDSDRLVSIITILLLNHSVVFSKHIH